MYKALYEEKKTQHLPSPTLSVISFPISIISEKTLFMIKKVSKQELILRFFILIASIKHLLEFAFSICVSVQILLEENLISPSMSYWIHNFKF